MNGDTANNMLAAGALAAAVMMSPAKVTVQFEETKLLNGFLVRFEFLRSTYAVTVERLPDE